MSLSWILLILAVGVWLFWRGFNEPAQSYDASSYLGIWLDRNYRWNARLGLYIIAGLLIVALLGYWMMWPSLAYALCGGVAPFGACLRALL